VAALELSSDAEEKVKQLLGVDDKKPQFSFKKSLVELSAQWTPLKQLEDEQVSALDLSAGADKKFRVALRKIGNDKLTQQARSSRAQSRSSTSTAEAGFEVTKVDGKGKRNKRQLVITSSSVNIFETGKLQKQPSQSIQFQAILQVITSTDNLTDFVLGVEDDLYSSFRFESEEGKRSEAVAAITAAYKASTGAFTTTNNNSNNTTACTDTCLPGTDLFKSFSMFLCLCSRWQNLF
jgi:hypothetical protein